MYRQTHPSPIEEPPDLRTFMSSKHRFAEELEGTLQVQHGSHEVAGRQTTTIDESRF